MNFKKLGLKSYLNPLAIVITYFCLLLESIKYPGFIGNHFFIDAKVYFAITIVLLLFCDTKSKVMSLVLKVNRLFLPIILLNYLVFSFIEGVHYRNYVLNTFHFHLDGLILPVLFSFAIYLTDKFKNVIPRVKGKIGIIYLALVFSIIYFAVKNIAFVSDMSFSTDSYILSHVQNSYDDKMFYQWGDFYRFMVFVRNTTPSSATIVIPPQEDPWLIGTGNPHFVRAFLYPRKIIQGAKIIPNVKVFGPNTFILISWGKEECIPVGCHGWPRQDIKATKIIYKDPDSEKMIETKENAIYKLEDDKYVYGVIKL